MMLRSLVLAVLALVAIGGLAHAQAGCVDVAGTFVNHAVHPPECTSPVLFCTHGDLSGDIEGDYDFTMMSQTPDPFGPPVTMTFTGVSTITLDDGILYANDHGRITFQVHDDSPFETHVVIDGGTGPYTQASGTLIARGAYDLVTGTGSGTYDGTICLP